MNLFDLFLTASSNMRRNKVRTFLTIIAIFIGAMTITLTNGIGTGIKSYVNKQIGNLGSPNVLIVTLTNSNEKPTNTPAKYSYNSKASITSSGFGGDQLLMTEKDLGIIRSIPNITNVVPSHSPSPDYIQGLGDKYEVTLTQQLGDSNADMVAGNNVSSSSTQNQISIPEDYVGPLGYSNNQAIIGQTITIGDVSGEGVQKTVTAVVTGVQQKSLLTQSASFANYTLASNLTAIENEGVPPALANTFQTAYATFPSNFTTSQINNLKTQLSNQGFTGQTIQDKESDIFTVINAVIIVFDLFGAIALLAASFGIINTLYMAVQERTKEIGLMKALGMGRKRIFLLFSIEAVLIGFWGSALGVLFASLIGKVINTIGSHGFLKNFPGLSLLTFPLKTVIIVIVGIILIAFLAGTLPALRASRKDPIDALRYE